MTADNLASQTRGDLTPLSDRLSLLLVVRLFMAGTVLSAGLILPHLTLDHLAITIARSYVGVAIGAELLHRFLSRHTNRRWLLLVNAMLLVDGAFVASILAFSGDARSTFIFLAYAHIVSVTLLVGFRTGLKMALWQSILLLTVYYLGLAEVIPVTTTKTGADRKLASQLEVAQAIALWIVAICTAVFASLNERELRRRKGELTIIADLSSEIEQTRRPSEILSALVKVSTEKLQAESALAVCAHAGSIIAVGDRESAPLIPGETLVSMGGVIEKAFHTAHPVLVKAFDPEADAILCKILPEALNISAIPLVAEGECVGVLVATWGDRTKRRVTQPMIDLMNNVAGRVALSLSNTFLLAEVQRLASVDGLTNLPNRRTFNQAIEREVARAGRSGQPVSLVMLDIDHFKSVNDQHGHQMGDTVLAESASGVMNACRGEDLPARYGGEEIVVIMPNCPAEQALAAAERIRVALSDANVTLPGTHASAGVATFPNNADDVASLLAAADEALYQSKENGRDRATLSRRAGSLNLSNVHS